MQNARQSAIRCLRDESEAILGLISQIDDSFETVVNKIYHCRGHLIITGVGKSGHIAAKMAATLASTGTPSFYLNSLDALHGDLGMVREEDIVMMISNSGTTDELLRIVACLEERSIPTIAMTGDPESLLAKNCAHHISVSVKREACPLNLAPTSSTTAAIAMGDALAVALMERRHFKATDFAMFHPSGSLGHKLLTRVKDVMYTTDFPLLPPTMKLSEAIIRISDGKLGLGVVATDDKNVLGIITDGDIRRAVEGAKSNFFNLEVSAIMTTNPKTISKDAKLVDIQRMFRTHKIHSLLVVDDSNRLIGIIDYFAIMT